MTRNKEHFLREMFYPKSVAVAGASPREDNMASMILKNLARWKFPGRVYGVNPACAGADVHGARVHASLEDIPGKVDLLVALSPARTVPGLIESCGRKKAGFAVIESAGFSELGAEGAKLGGEVVRAARASGVRFVGPNCLGIINADAKLTTPFSSIDPFAPGGVSVLSQSGGVGVSILAGLAEHNLAANKFVSMGNKYDLDECDFLEYLATDAGTKIVLMFLEGISRGRLFCEIAARCGKPVIVYKGNVTDAGRARAASHTGALANDDAVLDASLRQAGVIRVGSVSDLIRYARMFAQPRIAGRGLAVVSPAGGFAVVAADECSRAGFNFPPLSAGTRRTIESRLRAGIINVGNPIDLGDALTSESILASLGAAMTQEDVSAGLLVMPRRHARNYTGAFASLHSNMVPGLEALAKKSGKPVAAVIYAVPEVVADLRGASALPVYSEMGDAVRALAGYAEYCSSCGRANRVPPAARVSTAVRAALDACPDGLVTGAAAFAVLEAAGVPCAPCEEAKSASAAVRAASRIGYPVAMKISSAELSHKSDAGGVVLGISTAKEARVAADKLFAIMVKMKIVGGVMVQKMAEGGVELIAGARRDGSFGPVVMAGLGGVFVEVMKDTALRMAPVGAEEARGMLGSLSGAALLAGARGRARADVKSAAAAVSAISKLASACPRILELDVNPLIVHEKGCTAVDVRMVLG